jgi:hypothetical protein
MVLVGVHITHGTQLALFWDNSVVNGPPYITVASFFVNTDIIPTRRTPRTKFIGLYTSTYMNGIVA